MEILLSQFSRESFGKLRVLEIKACHDVLVVIPSSKLQVLHNLKQLIVRNCSSVKEVIQVEGRVGETLPQLTIMYLENLPMLTHLSGFGPFLQNLHSLQVSKCGKLINLVSPSMAKTLVQLEELTVSYCDEVKEIVENEGGEATDDKIVFTKLKKLKLHFLPNLKSFCSARYCIIFRSLTFVDIKECPQMEFFCQGDSFTPSLESVWMNNRREILENDLNTIIHKFTERVCYNSPDFLLLLTPSSPITILCISWILIIILSVYHLSILLAMRRRHRAQAHKIFMFFKSITHV